MLATLVGVGNVVELLISFNFKLPLQTSIIALRGVLVYIIFCILFWFYEVRTKKRVAKAQAIKVNENGKYYENKIFFMLVCFYWE